MIYLTYADQPSGVFSSQVIDVCNYINTISDKKIKLVAFISIHDFKRNRNKIQAEMPDSIVIPMLPKVSYWKFNSLFLFFTLLITGERKIIARNVLASNMALLLKPFLKLKICFDGRGAIAAEWNEYNVVQIAGWKEAINNWEKKSVINSDYRISVSSELVNYWNERYGYNQNKHVVIPCTLNSGFKATALNESVIKKIRGEFNFDDNDIVLAYAGSTAGWQSFDMLKSILENVLTENKNCKVLFLSQNDKNVEQLQKEFPVRILQKFVKHYEVTNILMACDYGILIREQSVTNKVASPTKFAEYLSAGLAVLISENIGDYTKFVKQNNCGTVVSSGNTISLHKNSIEERNRFITLVAAHYTKEANRENYLKLITAMNS
jgi:hypothetical protein